MTHTITRFLDTTYQLGECPTWDDRKNRLLWTDIQGRTIQSMDWESREITTWRFDNEVGSFGLTDDDRLVVSVWDKVLLFDPETGASDVLAEVEADEPRTRLNDGKVGPDGAFWVGTMDEGPEKEPIAALYRVDAGGYVERKADGFKISNGLAFSPDGGTMYHSDSRGPWVDAWDFDPATGAIGNRRRVVELTEEIGRPDGGRDPAKLEEMPLTGTVIVADSPVVGSPVSRFRDA